MRETEKTEEPNTAVGKLPDFLIPIGSAKLDLTGLSMQPGLTFETWESVGYVLSGLGVSTKWATGDWLLYGEHAYGEKFSQASTITGFSPNTLIVYQWVAKAFPRNRRRLGLTFYHHQLLAKLDEKDQERWLDLCERNGWTSNELRAQLQEEEHGKLKHEDLRKFFRMVLEWPDDPGAEILKKITLAARKLGGEMVKVLRRGLD